MSVLTLLLFPLSPRDETGAAGDHRAIFAAFAAALRRLAREVRA